MSVNKVILIGNVGKDPDVRYFDANKAVANFTLATTERARKGANDQIIPDCFFRESCVLENRTPRAKFSSHGG